MTATTLSIAALADLCEANDIRYLSEKDTTNATTVRYEDRLYRWQQVPAIVDMVAASDDSWKQVVDEELTRRAIARRHAALEASYAAQAPAVAAYLLSLDLNTRGLRDAKAHDLRHLAKQAQRATSNNGLRHEPYRPEAGCTAKLHLRDAVHFSHTQESYSDHVAYVVPVTIAAGANLEVCRRNLQRFAAAARTHTGFAGGGSTYTAELVGTELGYVVVIDQRVSIPD